MRPPGGTPSIPFLSPNEAKQHIHPSPCSLQLQDGVQRAARSWGRGGQGDAEGTGQPREAAGSGAGKAKHGGREGSRWSPPPKKKKQGAGFPRGALHGKRGWLRMVLPTGELRGAAFRHSSPEGRGGERGIW